jgi:signal transduction histidine kinase
MPPAYHGPERRSAARSSSDVERLQREANEKLVLSAIRAQEETDAALAARRRAEEEASEVRAREEELLASAELRERLIGIIGHDLRNPLDTIIMASALQMSHGQLTSDDARLATRIVNSGQRMARMIGQLVEFTRVRLGGGFDLSLKRCDLGEICKDIAEELRISSSAEIRQTVQGDVTGICDADRVAEALSNIAGNAVDHATPGTPVLMHARGDTEAVVVEITNQGACIPPDQLPVIFKAFRRADANAKSDGGHLGLGLYIACEIVRSHGGTLSVTSADETTTFTMRLPRSTAPRAANGEVRVD